MLTLVLAAVFAFPMASVCDAEAISMGNCSIGNSGSQVTVGGSVTTPGGGSPEQPIGAPWGDDGGPYTDGGGPIDAGPPPSNIDRGAICGFLPACRPDPAEPAEPEAPEPAAPAIDYSSITTADLVSFTPASVTASVEPSGLGIAGMPVNVVAGATSQTLQGDLFGQPISVLFEPVAYTFDYGDGEIRDTDTGGQSWETLGLPQFSATATSHAYASPGDYTISIAVHYAATIQAPNGVWFPVAGTVTAEATAEGVRIFEVNTALVQRTCTEDPTGPAC